MDGHRHTEKFLCAEDSDSEDNNCLNSFGDSLRLRNHQPLTRKRRRGMIEKRRRDRINNCLLELKRLVPAAFEKQNSQKLEKAEILQLTVDHLRFMSCKASGLDYHVSQKVAIEHICRGFKECITEINNFFHSSIPPIINVNSAIQFKETLKHQLMTHLERHLRMKRHQIFVAHPHQSYYSCSPDNAWNFTPNFQMQQQNSSAANYENLDNQNHKAPLTVANGGEHFFVPNNGQNSHFVDSARSNFYQPTPQQPKMISTARSVDLANISAPPPQSNELRGGGTELNLNLTFLAPNNPSNLVPLPHFAAPGYKF
uniref:BHLH domain-containing protein n=1 Tax=Romanomermis culicivorax TaxID=13658 RepID=A0A915K769_ROMCU